MYNLDTFKTDKITRKLWWSLFAIELIIEAVSMATEDLMNTGLINLF